jgi:2-dehydropantoate 2-reductase
MKICIYGAGAIGGLTAAWLARSGHDVSVIARGAQLDAIRSSGLRVQSKAKTEAFNVKAESDPARLGPQDYVLVTVKAQSLTGVAESIAPLFGTQTSVVTAMNGVPWWFFQGMKAQDNRLESLEAGLVRHNMGAKLILGEPGGKNTARTHRIAEALTAAGFEVVVTNEIEKDFWVKLLGNVSFNPVSALTVTTADQLIQNREVKAYMVAIMREVLAIGRAVGVDANIDPEARIDMARALGRFKTSMHQDLEAGKPLEIDGLLAGTLEIARKAGVRAPFTESLYGLIRARAQSTGQYR